MIERQGSKVNKTAKGKTRGRASPDASRAAKRLMLKAPEDHPLDGYPSEGLYTTSPVRGARPGDQFIVVHMRSDSLMGDNILEGEILICRTLRGQEEVKDDSLVLASTSTGLRVGHIHRKPDGRIGITPSTPGFTARVFKAENVEIIGVAVRHEWDTAEGERVEFYLEGREACDG